MKLITRKLNRFHIKAYGVVSDGDEVKVSTIAECETYATSMTKNAARAELARACGHKMPRGVTIDWESSGSVTYAMPVEEFIENAVIIETA